MVLCRTILKALAYYLAISDIKMYDVSHFSVDILKFEILKFSLEVKLRGHNKGN